MKKYTKKVSKHDNSKTSTVSYIPKEKIKSTATKYTSNRLLEFYIEPMEGHTLCFGFSWDHNYDHIDIEPGDLPKQMLIPGIYTGIVIEEWTDCRKRLKSLGFKETIKFYGNGKCSKLILVELLIEDEQQTKQTKEKRSVYKKRGSEEK